MKQKKIFHYHQGIIVLVLMMITSAVILMVAVSMSFLSINTSQIGLNHGYSSRVFINLDGCAEEALVQLNRNNNYSGGTLVIGNTTCTITTTGIDPDRMLTVIATNTDYTRKLQIDVTFFPVFIINSWQELTI